MSSAASRPRAWGVSQRAAVLDGEILIHQRGGELWGEQIEGEGAVMAEEFMVAVADAEVVVHGMEAQFRSPDETESGIVEARVFPDPATLHPGYLLY